MRLVAFLSALLLASVNPASAQSVQAPFNPLTDTGYLPSAPLSLGYEFVVEFGVAIPAPLTLMVPRNDALDIRYFAATDTGVLLQIRFLEAAASEADAVFLEDFQLTTATISMQPDAEDPVLARMQTAGRLLEQEAFPAFTSGDETARIIEINAVSLGNASDAVEMIATFVHPRYGFNALLRAVIVLHPDQEEAYLAVATIDADRVPVVDLATMEASLTGRILSSWHYD